MGGYLATIAGDEFCGAAQSKYNPDDQVVQDTAEKAVAALEKARPKDNGQYALGALAIVECSKRYTESVPRESKTVKEAIKRDSG